VSVAAAQLKSIWLEDAAVAVIPEGTLGAVVSGAAGVVAQDCTPCAEVLPLLSYAATV